jgi:phage terminase small subunit
MALTAKQEMFVAEYLVDLNATQAAIRAGYQEKTARQIGSENLSKPDIAEAIESAFKARSKRVNLNADYVLNNLVEISERCLQRAPVMEFDREEKQMEQKVDADGNHIWTFDAIGATKANELLGKHLKLFTDKTELSGANGEPLILAATTITVVRPPKRDA